MRFSLLEKGVAPKSCRGFTLVELMIALTLGLLLTIVIGYGYLASRQAFRTVDTLSRMQENARYVFELMSHDIRMAGFTGCRYIPPGSPPAAARNVLNTPTDWYKNLFGAPLVGYEEGVSVFPSDNYGVALPALRGDALTVLRADNSREYIVNNHNAGATQIQLTANHNFGQGEILVVADCANAAVFQASAISSDTITHGAVGTAPGNASANLGTTFPANSSRIMPLSAVNYYIGTNASGEPALYRHKLAASGGGAATVAEELAEGAENMQITYGVDTSALADKAADGYVPAASALGGPAVTDWSRVLSVRISLLMVSRSDQAITTAPQAYTYNGATTTPADRLLRKVFTTTISVRNRL